jgi:type II secretory pathway component PulF
MPEFLLKYADSRGEIRQQVAEAASEQELRHKFAEQGYLVYSVRPSKRPAAGRRRALRPRSPAEAGEVPHF